MNWRFFFDRRLKSNRWLNLKASSINPSFFYTFFFFQGLQVWRSDKMYRETDGLSYIMLTRNLWTCSTKQVEVLLQMIESPRFRLILIWMFLSEYLVTKMDCLSSRGKELNRGIGWWWCKWISAGFLPNSLCAVLVLQSGACFLALNCVVSWESVLDKY
jgi:hypothetical protein